MATIEVPARHGAARRLVAIDFDWGEADLLSELLRFPEIVIERVVGAHEDDPGFRAGAVCGVPRTLDLLGSAYARCDLALLGASSPRRGAVANFLAGLDLPVAEPRAFLQRLRTPEPSPTWSERAPARPLGELLLEAIPDLEPRPAGDER
ncbi:MAG: hypothetical protein ACREFI_13805, partial [Stellaceae bacterium]